MIKFIDYLFNQTFGRIFSNELHQFFRYLFCGGTATLVDLIILFSFTNIFHFNYLLAAAVGFSGGVATNYTLNIALVFQSSGKLKKEFPLFAFFSIIGLLLTETILWILVDRFGMYLIFAKLIAVVIVLNWNFFMRKKFVFRLGSKLETTLKA